MPEALPELVWFSLLFFCFAFVWCARKLLAALFQPLISAISHIPFTGSALTDLLHSIESDADNALGSIEHNIDALMGASWHRMAELNEWLWKELKKHTLIGQLAATEIRLLAGAYHSLRNLAHRAVGLVEGLPHDVKRLEREYHGIEAKVKQLTRELRHGIGDDVLPRLKSLDRRVEHITHDALPAIRSAEAQADAAISDLYSWAKGKASLLGVGTFAAAVAAVIGADVLKAIRCNELGNLFKKHGCGLWSLIGDLLGLAAFLTIAFDFQEFVDASQEAATFIGDAVVEFEGSFPISLPPLPPPSG